MCSDTSVGRGLCVGGQVCIPDQVTDLVMVTMYVVSLENIILERGAVNIWRDVAFVQGRRGWSSMGRGEE